MGSSCGIFSLSLESGMLLSWTEPESTDSICPPGAVKKIFVPDSRLKSRAFDDLDILPSGNIITSEFSLKYSLDELNKELFEARPNGR